MTSALMATPSLAVSAYRLIVVVGGPDDPRVDRQNAELARDARALAERDVVVQALTPDAARRTRPELRVPAQATFEVLLVGKDGGVKLRRDQPVPASEMAALIDAMPMRREVMKR